MFALIRLIKAMSVKTTAVPMLMISMVMMCLPLLKCCAPEPETVFFTETTKERSAVLEQDEICQFAQQLILESGLDDSVLHNFKKGDIMISDETNGILAEVNDQQYQKIKEIENDGMRKVWHIIDGVYHFPQGDRRVITYLIARKDSTNIRRAGECLLSHDYSWFCDTQKGDFGDSIVKLQGSRLHREA